MTRERRKMKKEKQYFDGIVSLFLIVNVTLVFLSTEPMLHEWSVFFIQKAQTGSRFTIPLFIVNILIKILEYYDKKEYTQKPEEE